MTHLINAYSTLREPPEMQFAHELNNRRDRSDPELAEHLNGFAGYVAQRGEEMTQTLFHVIQHIRRVQHNISFNVEDDALNGMAGWGWEANAILFFADGTVRDPSGNVLVYPNGQPADDEAEVPYPEDARERKARSEKALAKRGVKVVASLPPVVGEGEVALRSPAEVAVRMLALFVVAVRAESLATKDEIPVAKLIAAWPLAFEGRSPKERVFLKAKAPAQQEIVNFAWRYEALALLQWALGLAEELPFPTAICDVPKAAKTAIESNKAAFIPSAKLRPAGEILDGLDLHYRLHWAVRQARLDKRDSPAGVEAGVVSERHHALNWLVRHGDAEWDDVDTPT